MGWATEYIYQLNNGETVTFTAHGSSMTGKINSGDSVTVAPVKNTALLGVGDIVLCKVKGNQFLHLITKIQGRSYQIANNQGRVNGWISIHSIYGKVVSRNGVPINSQPVSTGKDDVNE